MFDSKVTADKRQNKNTQFLRTEVKRIPFHICIGTLSHSAGNGSSSAANGPPLPNAPPPPPQPTGPSPVMQFGGGGSGPGKGLGLFSIRKFCPLFWTLILYEPAISVPVGPGGERQHSPAIPGLGGADNRPF